jgi:hypothetical protein
MKTKLIVFGAVAGLILLVFGVDYLISVVRIKNTVFVMDHPPRAMADSEAKVEFHLQVTEKGRPRAGDLMQAWVQQGDGKLLPLFFFLDEDGRGVLTLTPNVLSLYSKNPLIITVYDLSIGKIVERGKKETYSIELYKPGDS